MRFDISLLLLLGLTVLTAQAQPNTCRPLDLTFLLDASGSIQFHSPRNWPDLIAFCNRLIRFIGSKTHTSKVAAISFSKTASVNFNFRPMDVNGVIADLNSLPTPGTGGKTNINAALNRAIDISRNRSGRKIALLITDGGSTEEIYQVKGTAERLRNSGTTIVAITIKTQDYNPDELRDIVGPGGTIYELQSYQQLQTYFEAVLSDLCNPGPCCPCPRP